MSSDRNSPDGYEVTLRLSVREKSDLAAALEAVVAAATELDATVELTEVGPPQAAPTESAIVRDEPLETDARKLAQEVLDAAAKEAEKKGVAAERDIERMRAEIVAQRKGFRAYIAFWAGQSFRVCVEIFENTVGLLAEKTAAVFGGKKKD